jgi:hypothetical protein
MEIAYLKQKKKYIFAGSRKAHIHTLHTPTGYTTTLHLHANAMHPNAMHAYPWTALFSASQYQHANCGYRIQTGFLILIAACHLSLLIQ